MALVFMLMEKPNLWMITRTKDAGLQGVNAGSPDPIIGYVYNYDNANRITAADFGYYHSTSGWSNSLPKAAMYNLPLISYDKDGNVKTIKTTERTVGGTKNVTSENVGLNSLSEETQNFINESIKHLKESRSSYVQTQIQKQNNQDRANNDLFIDILSGGSVLNRFIPVMSKALRTFLGAFTFSYKYFSDEMLNINNYGLKVK